MRSQNGSDMFLTHVGGVVVDVSLKVAATISSVTRQLKKICDTCHGEREGGRRAQAAGARATRRVGSDSPAHRASGEGPPRRFQVAQQG